MRIEDYLKYRIQGGDIYVLPVDIFDELFDKLLNFQNESKKLKETLNKIKSEIERKIDFCSSESEGYINHEKCDKTIFFFKGLIKDLKEV